MTARARQGSAFTAGLVVACAGCQGAEVTTAPPPRVAVISAAAPPKPAQLPEPVAPRVAASVAAPTPTFGVVVEGQCSELGVGFFENATVVHYGDIPGTAYPDRVPVHLVLALVRDDGSIDEDPKLTAWLPKTSEFGGMGETFIPMEFDAVAGTWPEGASLTIAGGGGERIGTRTDTFVWRGDHWVPPGPQRVAPEAAGAEHAQAWVSGTSWLHGSTLASVQEDRQGAYPSFQVFPKGSAPVPDFTALHVKEKPTCWFRESARVTRPSGELFVAGKFCGIFPTHEMYPLPEGEAAVARWAPGARATIEPIPAELDHASLSLDSILETSPTAFYLFGTVGRCNPTCVPYLAIRDGTTWTRIAAPYKGFVSRHELEADGTLWVLDQDQGLYRYGTDGTWTTQPIGAATSVAWVHGRPAWAVVNGAVMQRTEGGEWTKRELPAPAFSTGAKLQAHRVAISPRGEVWVSGSYAEHRPEWTMAESREVLLRLGATHAATHCEVAKGPSFSSWPAPATATCETPVAILARVAKSAPADYDFPQTRGAVRGHKELLGTEFVEIDLDGKRLLAAKVPSLDVGKHLVSLVSEAVHGTRPEVVCLQPKVTRPVVVDLEGKAPVGKKRR